MSRSRRRKRIAAVTTLMVAVLGLGLAGYIQATRASGRDNIAGNVDGKRSHGYRLNHQVGLGDAREWYVASNQFAGTFEEDSSKQADEKAAGSNEPENADETLADTETYGTSDFVGSSGGGVPGSAPALAKGDAGGSSTLRLARAFGSSFAGGSGGGGGNGGNNGAPSGNGPGTDNPPPSEKPKATDPTPEQPVNPPTDPKQPDPVVDPTPDTPTDEPKPPYVPDKPNDTKPVSVPEPATLGLFGLGIAAVGFMRRRRNQA